MSLQGIIDREPYQKFCDSVHLTEEFVENLLDAKLNVAIPQDNPTILHTLGVPGAGKSTYVNSLDQNNKVLISFDNIMESLPAYITDKKILGAEKSFSKWELPARMIGYELLHRAVETERNVIFDHSGSRSDHADFLNVSKKEYGYRVEIVPFMITNELALARAEQREANGGRHVPPEYIPQRQKALAELMPRYQEIADEFTLMQAVDNGPPIILSHHSKGRKFLRN